MVDFVVNGSDYGQAPLVGGTANLPIVVGYPGIYPVTAYYIGDAKNAGSSSATLSQTISGTLSIVVIAQTSTLTHTFSATVNLQ